MYRKLNVEMCSRNAKMAEFAGTHKFFCNGVEYVQITEYDMDRGYLDYIAERKHYMGVEVYKSPLTLNGRVLINRIFGEIEVRAE